MQHSSNSRTLKEIFDQTCNQGNFFEKLESSICKKWRILVLVEIIKQLFNGGCNGPERLNEYSGENSRKREIDESFGFVGKAYKIFLFIIIL